MDRLAAACLVALMAIGSLALWVGIPAGWLWVAGQITAEPAQHVVLSVAGTPLAIIAWARVLFWLNRLYLRVRAAGATAPPTDEESDEERWMHGPLEPLLVGSLLIALAAMAFWFFVLAEDPPAMLFSVRVPR